MRRIEGRLENARVRMQVGIRRFQAFADPSSGASFEYFPFMALVDTGARRTCVSQNVVQQVGLQRCGRVDVWNIKRSETHWTYLFNLAFLPTHDDAGELSVQSWFGYDAEIEGIDVGNHPYFDVLIGMDVLSKFDFCIFRSGAFQIQL